MRKNGVRRLEGRSKGKRGELNGTRKGNWGREGKRGRKEGRSK